MTTSFEKVWKEYVEHCKTECESEGTTETDDLVAELDDTKLDYMHFYDFLRYKEEISILKIEECINE